MTCACGNLVEPEREALGLSICSQCGSKVQKVRGVMVVDGKSFVDILIVSEQQQALLVRPHRLSGNQCPPN